MRNILLFLVICAGLLLFASCIKPTNPDQVATPAFTPASGTYQAGQEISLTCATSGAEIRYTVDGSLPTSTSTLYTGPLVIPDIFAGKSTTGTVKAMAFKEDWDPSETASATYTVLSSEMPDNFVFVEGGTFSNGTGSMTVSSFYIDKYECTQQRFIDVMGTNPSEFNDDLDKPVEFTTWYTPIEYCNRRSVQEGLTPYYSYSTFGTDPADWPAGWNSNDTNQSNVQCNWSANGYRLPTEMEWMFAARGGNLTHNYTYSGSNNIDEIAWYWGNDQSGTHHVGTKAPNELGLYDMSGNVWEWVWDTLADYPTDPQTDYHGPADSFWHIGRGGCWGNDANGCTVDIRGQIPAFTYGNHLGFRVVRVAP
jgi:formylglycine-generating enzyme